MTTILERMARRVIRAERVAVRRWAAMNQPMWFTSGWSAEQRCEAYYRAADRRDRAIRAFDAYGTGPAGGAADRPVLTLEGDPADMSDPGWLLGLAHGDMVVVTVGDGPDAEREVCAWVDFCRSNPDDAAEVAADLLASGRWVGGGGAADDCASAVERGATREAAFAAAFNPNRSMHAVARRLGLSLSVDRCRWVIAKAEGGAR